MPLIDYTKAYRDRLSALLETGEQLHLVGQFQLGMGDTDELELPYADQSRIEQSTTRKYGGKLERRERSQQRLVLGLGIAGLYSNPRFMSRSRRVLAPRMGSGGPTSAASQFVAAVKRSDNATMCAATNRRFIVLKREYGRDVAATGSQFEVVAVIRREQIAEVRRAGRLLVFPQRGRVLFTFVDGSEVAVMTGLLTASRADAIVAALTS